MLSKPLTIKFPAPPNYGKSGWLSDLLPGFTLGIILVPQAMAYGMLAGVDPVFGLYAALVPLVVYSLLASTPHVSVGPTALASLLCLNGLSAFADPLTPEYLGLTILLAALTGGLQLLFGLLRLGGITSLLSRPVLSGFVSAAALLIITSQLDALLGIPTERTTYLHENLTELFKNILQLNPVTSILGIGSLLALLAANRWLPAKFPTMLVLIALTTTLVWAAGQTWGVQTIGEVPAGLPEISLPAFSGKLVLDLLPVALVLALISFIETVSIGKAFSPKYPYYRVEPNRELIALGLSKIVGSFFQGIPSSASFSRSAVVESNGGKGPLSNIFAAVLLILVLLFLTPLFYFLPIPVLAAIIIFSVRKLFDFSEMKRLGNLAPKEFTTLMITFLFTLFAGLQWGIAGGVVLSLAFVFWRAARPHLAELGRVPGTNAFRNLNRFAQAEVDPTVLIVRFDAELNFGNAGFFRDRLQALADARGPELRAIIIDAHTINDMDTSGIFALTQLYEALRQQDVELYLCGVIGPVRDMLFRCGLMQRIGADHNYLSIQEALLHLAGEQSADDWGKPAVQHD